MRSSVVLPEPEGPSSATQFARPISSETPRRAGVAVEVLGRFCTVADRHGHGVPPLSGAAGGELAGVAPFEQRFETSVTRASPASSDGDREGGDEIILVVENFDLQRHGVGQAANMAGDDRHRAEFAHGAGIAEQHAVEQRPFDVGQRDT